MTAASAKSAGPRPKEARLIEVATTLFSRYGLRATSMEEIARQAGVAKATAYAYFRDKDDVFRAVCERVARDIVVAAEAAAATACDPAGRLAAALSTKYQRIFALVYSSPHAAEILASTDQLATAALLAADADFEKLLAAALRPLAPPRQAHPIARLLIAAAEGITRKVKSAAEVDSALRQLIDLVLAGLRATETTKKAPRKKRAR